MKVDELILLYFKFAKHFKRSYITEYLGTCRQVIQNKYEYIDLKELKYLIDKKLNEDI